MVPNLSAGIAHRQRRGDHQGLRRAGSFKARSDAKAEIAFLRIASR
jgi:hypothetical protein